MMKQNPLMGLALVMTPSKATIHIKGEVAFAKARVLGYEIQHYYNEQTDEVQPDEAVTAAYRPSQSYEALFTDDKRITSNKSLIYTFSYL